MTWQDSDDVLHKAKYIRFGNTPPSGNATLWNAHGRTCVTKPVGLEFITLPMPADVLRPQDALEITLQFRSAEMEPIEFSTKILASPGER